MFVHQKITGERADLGNQDKAKLNPQHLIIPRSLIIFAPKQILSYQMTRGEMKREEDEKKEPVRVNLLS